MRDAVPAMEGVHFFIRVLVLAFYYWRIQTSSAEERAPIKRPEVSPSCDPK